jgi:putative membrane protein insertion efficiency factor
MTLARAAVGLLGAYKRWVSPLLPAACRFEPTCSEYAAQAITEHGMYRGSRLALARIARCHPLSAGGFDPVPPPARTRAPRPERPS